MARVGNVFKSVCHSAHRKRGVSASVTATAVVGTHPTGMYSCLWLIFAKRGGWPPYPPGSVTGLLCPKGEISEMTMHLNFDKFKLRDRIFKIKNPLRK